MKELLTLLILLAASCTVEAGERHKPGDKWPAPDGCNTCEMDANRLASCTLMYCNPAPNEIEIYGPDIQPSSCYQRMQEAMKEADLLLNQTAGVIIYDRETGKMWLRPDENFVKDWNVVMRECVR